MKTTIELPDSLFRQAKITAAERGQTLRALITEALRDHLTGSATNSTPVEPPIMAAFGELRDLHDETMRIQALIDEEFGQIEDEDRQ